MLLKESQVVPIDRCGVWLIKVVHVYRKLKKVGEIGFFLRTTVQETLPENWLQKKKKLKGFIVRSFKVKARQNFIAYKSTTHGVVNLKKRFTPIGTRVIGPIDFLINRKRARTSFIKIL